MTFKEYRQEQSHSAKFVCDIADGKNLIKKTYDQADFEEDEQYVLDDYQVKVKSVNWGFDKHFLALTK